MEIGMCSDDYRRWKVNGPIVLAQDQGHDPCPVPQGHDLGHDHTDEGLDLMEGHTPGHRLAHVQAQEIIVLDTGGIAETVLDDVIDLHHTVQVIHGLDIALRQTAQIIPGHGVVLHLVLVVPDETIAGEILTDLNYIQRKNFISCIIEKLLYVLFWNCAVQKWFKLIWLGGNFASHILQQMPLICK